MAITPRTGTELAALAKEGLRARRARRRIKANLAAGRVTLAEVLELGKNGTGDTILGRMRIGQVLDACPGIGPVTCTHLLEDAQLDANTHLDRLTRDQRDLILVLAP